MKLWAIVIVISITTWLASPTQGLAQEPVRGYAMGDPMPGSQAPAFVLPYVRADGPGPPEQPFSLAAELGRVVVLAFCPRPADSAAVALLLGLAVRHDSLVTGEVILAAILPEGSERLTGRSADLSLPYKLLADSLDRVRRRYGVDRRELAVYVVGPRGNVAWREMRFNPFLPMSYRHLAQAIQRAAGGASGR